MPDLKISQLPVATTPLAGTELVPIVQGGTTDQTTVQAIMTSTVPSGTANGVLYLNGSKVATSGTDLVFNATGLGIGTSSPASKLDVNGAISVSGIEAIRNRVFAYSGSYSATQVGSPSSNNGNVALAVDVNSVAGGGFSGSNQVILPNNGALFVNAAGSDFIGAIRRDSSNRILIGPNTASGLTSGDLVIDTSGNLGIGTSSPTSKLTIGTGTYSAAASGTAGLYVQASGLVVLADGFFVGTRAGADRLTLDSSGNLGLGVTPSAWDSRRALQVGAAALASADSNRSVAELSANSYLSSGGAFRYIYSANASLYQQVTGEHRWFTAPSGTAGNAISFTQAMTLDASGNLMVGTTGAVGRFTLENAATTTEITLRSTGGVGINNRARIIGGYEAGGSDYGGYLAFNTTSSSNINTERARITSTGNVVAGGSVALATNATDGFLYVPTCAGTPTGTPTAITGMAPIVVDTTNNKMYFYSGGAWRDAGP